MRLACGLLAVSLALAQLPKDRIKEELKKFGHGEGRLKVGEPAADFTLKRLHSEQTVQLSSFRGVKPVALVFGSYTWPPFRAQVGALNAMQVKYAKDVEFLLIYIREAHPTDGWQLPANERDKVLLPASRTIEEKNEHATSCVRTLGIKFTTLVDGMDNKVELDYSGWPDRLYLVGRDGRIAWKGQQGPRGFRPPELEAAIRKELGK